METALRQCNALLTALFFLCYAYQFVYIPFGIKKTAVTVPEPLPEDDPLWDAKNILITPHCAGNFSLQITRDKDVTLFCEDLENYAAGRPLARLVDRRLGY